MNKVLHKKMLDRKEITVFISSPGDCIPERQAVRDILQELNKTSAKSKGIFFQDVGWEELPPGLGTGAQEVIDKQLGPYNILIGIMWLRFGTPVPGGAKSGTEHEVDLAIESWKKAGEPRVMFYFKDEPPPSLSAIDPDQLSRIQVFRKKLQAGGLTGSFRDISDFKDKLRVHLNNLIESLDDKGQNSPSKQAAIPTIPYRSFTSNFRDVIAPVYFEEKRSFLHIVFGNITDIRKATVVVGVSQDFDFKQRSPKGVLGSFEYVRIDGKPFFDFLEELWPEQVRPKAAGLGISKYLTLPQNDNELEGVIFTVTTRNLSPNPSDYGRYVSTPVIGIDHVIKKILEEAKSKDVQFLALPLLGAGFANIRRTHNSETLRLLIEKAILCITLQRLESTLRDPASSLRRGVIVIFSLRPSSEREHDMWTFATTFLGSESNKRKIILDSLLNDIEK